MTHPDAKLTAEEREELLQCFRYGPRTALIALVESILAERAQSGDMGQREGGQNTATTHYDYRESPPAAPVRSMKEFRERYGDSAVPDCPACGGTGKVPSEWVQSGGVASPTEEVMPPGAEHRNAVRASVASPPAAPSPDLAALRERWHFVCEPVREHPHMSVTILDARRLVEAGDALLVALTTLSEAGNG